MNRRELFGGLAVLGTPAIGHGFGYDDEDAAAVGIPTVPEPDPDRFDTFWNPHNEDAYILVKWRHSSTLCIPLHLVNAGGYVAIGDPMKRRVEMVTWEKARPVGPVLRKWKREHSG